MIPWFLFDRLLGEIGGGHEIQQNLQRFAEAVGASEEVSRPVEGSIGVGGGAGFGVLLEGIPFLTFEELVLKEMGDAVRYLHHFPIPY